MIKLSLDSGPVLIETSAGPNITMTFKTYLSTRVDPRDITEYYITMQNPPPFLYIFLAG